MRRMLAVMLVMGSAAQAEAQALRPTEMLTLSFAGVQRRVAVYVPRSYRAGVPVPVVLAFHGSTGDLSVSFRRYGIPEAAEREGFLAVFPEGLPEAGRTPDELYWGDAANVPYMGHVLDVVQGRWTVDARRVYAMGFSGGAKHSYRMAADPVLSRRFAAMGTVAGGMVEQQDLAAPGVVIDPTRADCRCRCSSCRARGTRNSRSTKARTRTGSSTCRSRRRSRCRSGTPAPALR